MLPPPAPISIMSIGGNGDGQAAAFLEAIAAIDLEQAGDQRLAVLDQAGLRGGAAHVERHQPVDAEHVAIVAGGERAGGRAALDHAHGIAARRLRADHAAGAEHDQRGVGEAFARQPLAQAPQIGLGDRHRVGVDGGRRCARKLADLRRDVRGQRDEQLRASSSPSRSATSRSWPGLAKLLRKQIATECTFLAFNSRGDGIDLRQVGRGQHAAIGAGALGDAEGQRRAAPAAPEIRSADRTSRSDARCGCAGCRGSPR